MPKTIEEILTPRPEIRLRIYAYAIAFIESQIAEHNDTVPDDVVAEESADD